MSISVSIILPALGFAIVVLFWAVIRSERSPLLALVAVVFAMVGGLGCWYSWVESHSVPWTCGYGAFSFVSLVMAVRHVLPASDQPGARQIDES